MVGKETENTRANSLLVSKVDAPEQKKGENSCASTFLGCGIKIDWRAVELVTNEDPLQPTDDTALQK